MKFRASRYYVLLGGIIVFGIALRNIGLHWLSGVAPNPYFTFHPDAYRAIRAITEWNFSIPDGYLLGMTMHLYLVSEAVSSFLATEVNLPVTLRIVSMTYGALTIGLIAVIARYWGFPRRVSLVSALFLALSPLHAMNSHLGTADAAATFYFWMTLFAGWGYVRTQRPALFILFAALVGASLAIKFFISLLLPLFIVILFEERARPLEKAATAALVMAGSFSIFSFFSYTPWNLTALLNMLLWDNVVIPGGHPPLEQFGLYLWDTISSLGLAIWVLFVIGLAYTIVSRVSRGLPVLRTQALKQELKTALRSPATVFVSGFVAHTVLVLSAEIHNVRHVLPYVPLVCLLASQGFWRLTQSLPHARWTAPLLLCLVCGYQTYAVVGVQKLYTDDIRQDIAHWLSKNVKNGQVTGVLMDYSRVKDVQKLSGHNQLFLNADYFVTCDLEFERYFRSLDAAEIHHAFGGQDRVRFYRDLFAGELPFEIAFTTMSKANTLELWFVKLGLLRPLGTLTPGECVVFRRSGS
jgi:hypothetical protein